MPALHRIDKVLLTFVAGFLFMLVATAYAPGLQTIVAGVACPSWASDAAVVRYPYVDGPTEMVRNFPLVCYSHDRDRAELASHARVLPALVVVGVAIGAAAFGVAALVRRAARSTEMVGDHGDHSDHGDAERGDATPSVRWLPLLISTPFVFLATYGAYWWLAVDTPYRRTVCRTNTGSPAACHDGEVVYRVITPLFATLAAVAFAAWVVAVVRSRRQVFDHTVLALQNERVPGADSSRP